MPRIFVLTTLPHSKPTVDRFERVNGRHSLRLEAPRSIGLPYGVYPRLILAWLTTEAVRTKNPEIHLGATPNDLARKLALSTISGPRGTAHRLEDQLHRLLSMRLDWQTTVGLHPTSSGSGFVAANQTSWLELARELLLRIQPAWRSSIVLCQTFFEEVTRSAIPVDLRAIRQLQRSPLAIDLYTWLTYRMSSLGKPTLIPWNSLQAQFGADYSRPRDFRRRVSKYLEAVLGIYPAVRLSQSKSGLRLYPSPPHIGRAPVSTSGIGRGTKSLEVGGRRSRTP
ncbi:MAG: replication protein RepA [Thermoanaerobaculia bacterium]